MAAWKLFVGRTGGAGLPAGPPVRNRGGSAPWTSLVQADRRAGSVLAGAGAGLPGPFARPEKFPTQPFRPVRGWWMLGC